MPLNSTNIKMVESVRPEGVRRRCGGGWRGEGAGGCRQQAAAPFMSLIHEMCFEWLTRLWFTFDVTYQICMVGALCGCSAEMAVIVSHTRGAHAFEVRLQGPSRCPRYIRGQRRVRHPQGRVLAASPPPGAPLARNSVFVPLPTARRPSQEAVQPE